MSSPAIPPFCTVTADEPAATPHDAIFEVRVVKHRGLLLAWHQDRYTVRGSYGQCQAALAEARQHNLRLGWWSLPSVLGLNWKALSDNTTAGKNLARHAARAFGHPSAYTGPAALQLVPTGS